MRKLIGFGAVLGSVFAVWACSSSSPAPANNNDNDSGSSSGGSSSGGSSSGGADAAPSCSESQIQAMAAAEGYAFDGGADASLDGGATGACVQAMCKDELNACATEDCTTCGGNVANCAISKCITALPTFDSGPAPDGCVAPSDCVALAACCTEISSIATLYAPLQTFATTCTTNAASCSQSECKQTITAVNGIMTGLCPLPDGG
jgi:hypothetical protein